METRVDGRATLCKRLQLPNAWFCIVVTPSGNSTEEIFSHESKAATPTVVTVSGMVYVLPSLPAGCARSVFTSLSNKAPLLTVKLDDLFLQNCRKDEQPANAHYSIEEL